MFHANPALTGVVEGNLPDKPKLLWTFKATGPVKSSPAIVQGRVYVGSDDGTIYSLSLTNGTKAWAYKTGGPVESSPLVLEGKVFAGSGDGFLYALDAQNGKLLWKYETGDKIVGSPNYFEAPLTAPATNPSSIIQHPASSIADPASANSNHVSRFTFQIFIGSYDFKLHCLDAATGHTNWVFETGNYINGAPAVADGKTVFGGCDGLLHVIGLADAKEQKSVEAGAYIAGSAALAGGRAYFGQYENEFLCVDIKAASIAWKFKDRNFPYYSTPAVTADKVIFGARDKLLHCVRRSDGGVLWSFSTRGKVDSSPAVCGGKVVVGSDDGRLYIVSLADGKELWSYEIGQAIESSPAVADRKVVVGCNDGAVYGFGTR